jgi:hypothetical protein
MMFEGVNWIYLAQDNAIAGSCEHDNQTLCSIEGWGYLTR